MPVRGFACAHGSSIAYLFVLEPGQVNLEGRALSRLAVNIDEAVVLLHDAVHRGKAHAGTLSNLLGGEKGLKDLLTGLFVHAAAIVADRKKDVLPGDKTRVLSAICLVKLRLARSRW